MSARDPRHAVRLWLVGVALPCLAMLAVAGVATAFDGGSTDRREAVACFPAASWDGRPEDRPCNAVGRPQEDGSGLLRPGTAGGDLATCAVPNPREERGRFVIRCRRVPR